MKGERKVNEGGGKVNVKVIRSELTHEQEVSLVHPPPSREEIGQTRKEIKQTPEESSNKD